MPRQKKTDETPEVDYKEIHETKVEDLVGEPSKEEAVKPEEPESPKEKVEETEIEFDPAKFKEELKTEIVGALQQTAQKTKEEATDEYAKFEKEVWEKENRTPTYKEALEFIKTSAIQTLKDEEAKKQQEIQEQQKRQEEYNKQQIESFNRYTDDQLADLKAVGKITTDEERRALFQAMLDTNVQRQKEGKPPILSIKEIYYEHYKAPSAQPAGADAPVSPGTGSVDRETPEINYNDIRRKSFMDILMGR